RAHRAPPPLPYTTLFRSCNKAIAAIRRSSSDSRTVPSITHTRRDDQRRRGGALSRTRHVLRSCRTTAPNDRFLSRPTPVVVKPTYIGYRSQPNPRHVRRSY